MGDVSAKKTQELRDGVTNKVSFCSGIKYINIGNNLVYIKEMLRTKRNMQVEKVGFSFFCS